MQKYVHNTDIHNKISPSFIVSEVVKLVNPLSVVDVGCGTGAFLAVFKEHGINELLGIEGEWLNRNQLEIDEKFVIIADLEKYFSYKKRFDLAVCLEVAEHISENAADNIIDTLTGLSDVILFSSAVPGQIGQNHLNLKWAEYWQQKFRAKGYSYYDEIRNRIWNYPKVNWWYKQNSFLVIKNGSNKYGFKENQKIRNRFHPEFQASFPDLIKNFVTGKMNINFFLTGIKKKILRKISNQ